MQATRVTVVGSGLLDAARNKAEQPSSKLFQGSLDRFYGFLISVNTVGPNRARTGFCSCDPLVKHRDPVRSTLILICFKEDFAPYFRLKLNVYDINLENTSKLFQDEFNLQFNCKTGTNYTV